MTTILLDDSGVLKCMTYVPEEEIWKDIPDYEGYYEISNMGRVRSKERYLSRGGSPYLRKSKVLKLQPHNKRKYLAICLAKDKVHKLCQVHRLVAKTFILNPENKPYVNHINSIGTDNRVQNLEWCTPKENTQHGMKFGRFKPGVNRGQWKYRRNCLHCGMEFQGKRESSRCCSPHCRMKYRYRNNKKKEV